VVKICDLGCPVRCRLGHLHGFKCKGTSELSLFLRISSHVVFAGAIGFTVVLVCPQGWLATGSFVRYGLSGFTALHGTGASEARSRGSFCGLLTYLPLVSIMTNHVPLTWQHTCSVVVPDSLRELHAVPGLLLVQTYEGHRPESMIQDPLSQTPAQPA
jgi:hypothetical protein